MARTESGAKIPGGVNAEASAAHVQIMGSLRSKSETTYVYECADHGTKWEAPTREEAVHLMNANPCPRC